MSPPARSRRDEARRLRQPAGENPARRRYEADARCALALTRVAARTSTAPALRGLRRARKRALRTLSRASAASVRPALRALRSADRLAGGSLPGMRRSPNRLRQRTLGASLRGRRPEGGGGLEGTWPTTPGSRAGGDRRRGRSAAAGDGAHLRAGAARAGALTRLSPGPLAGARAGAHLGAAVCSAARARRLAEAPARSGSQRAQPKCRLCLRASGRRQCAHSRLPDRRCLHQRRHVYGLRKRPAPGRLPSRRGGSPCEGCSRTLEGGRVVARRATVRLTASASSQDRYISRTHAGGVSPSRRLSLMDRTGRKPATSRKLRSA